LTIHFHSLCIFDAYLIVIVSLIRIQKPIFMKQFFSFMAAAMISFGASAQLPDGSIAPDFTATDINGVEHSLYAYLDSGYQVIVDFSATWCGPCWNYHTNGIFEELYETYGPDGTNEIRILWIEGDDTTTEADLYGTGTQTVGNWVAGTTFPIIDNGGSIFDAFGGAYYPTIYTICPSRVLTESGQTTVAGHASIFQANNCQPATLANDAALGSYTGDGLVCGDASATLSVELQNMGLENLTSCSIKAYNNGSEIASTDWTGNLSTYAFTDVTVGNASFTSTPNLTFEITSADGNDTNNSTSGAVALSPETTTYVQVRVTTDNWPEETGWEIVNDMGMVIESVAVGSLSSADTEFTWDVGLPGTGCYSFTMFDSYGDGLYASQWGNYQDGTAGVYGMDGESQIDIVFEYDGASGVQFGELSVGMEATTVTGIDEITLSSTAVAFPNPTNGNANVEFNTTTAAMASLEVINLIGERVMFNTLGNLPAGLNRANFDLSGLQAGIYLVNLNAGGETTTMRITKQ